ncbi:MAG: hypothetical protein ACLU40_00205 [Acutalibacteraceae bacterium]
MGMHGFTVQGDLDETCLAETVEKAAQIYMLTAHSENKTMWIMK